VQNLQTSKLFEELGLGGGNKKEKAKIIRLLTEVKLMSPNIYNRRSLTGRVHLSVQKLLGLE